MTHMHGLGTFDSELSNTRDIEVDGITLKVLSIERISKRAAGRPKDLAAIPALEEALAAISDSGLG